MLVCDRAIVYLWYFVIYEVNVPPIFNQIGMKGGIKWRIEVNWNEALNKERAISLIIQNAVSQRKLAQCRVK